MEQEIVLKLNVGQVNAILTALSEQPYKSAAPIIHSIQAQAQPQLNPAPADEGTKAPAGVGAVVSEIPELPLYQCHKQVRAAKIISTGSGRVPGEVELFLDGEVMVTVDVAWVARNPQLESGGYFVHYQEGDDYTTYSPAGPFESGYTKL